MLLFLLAASVAAQPPADTPERISVRVHGSIDASLSRQLPADGPALAAQVARLIRWRGDMVRDVHPNDKVTLLFTRDEQPILLALHYRGSAITLDAYGFAGDEGVLRYYDETGRMVEPTLNHPPLDSYVQITEGVQSGSGKRRHRGIDFKAVEGTPIRLPYAAVVSRVNWSTRTNGHCVDVVFTDGKAAGLRALFLHLQSVDPTMRAGKRLAAGSAVGTVGSTGRSSAPHLHYELHTKQGKVRDPLQIHGTFHRRVAAEQRQAFEETRKRLAMLLDGALASN